MAKLSKPTGLSRIDIMEKLRIGPFDVAVNMKFWKTLLIILLDACDFNDIKLRPELCGPFPSVRSFAYIEI